MAKCQQVECESQACLGEMVSFSKLVNGEEEKTEMILFTFTDSNGMVTM